MEYMTGAFKGAGLCAVLGAALGAYSVHLDRKRKHVANLGQPDLVHLDEAPELVYALDFVRTGRGRSGPVPVDQLANSLDQLLNLIGRVGAEPTGALKIHAMRKCGEARGHLRRIVERIGDAPGGGIEEQIGVVNTFICNSEHNLVVC
jgi:hypothetical protein